MVVIAHTVGTTAVRVLDRDRTRTSLTIVNNHATAILYWSDEDPSVSVDTGLPIFSRGAMTLTVLDGDDPTLGQFVISDTAATPVRVYEGHAKR